MPVKYTNKRFIVNTSTDVAGVMIAGKMSSNSLRYVLGFQANICQNIGFF